MKLSDGIEYNITGECSIDIDKVVKCFGKSYISHYETSDNYRLVNSRAHVKVSISKEDALALTERLNLVEIPNIFFHSSAFVRR